MKNDFGHQNSYKLDKLLIFTTKRCFSSHKIEKISFYYILLYTLDSMNSFILYI